MMLQDWMKEHRYTDVAFTKEINAILERNGYKPFGWRAVWHWRSGNVIPRPPIVAAIAEFTKKKVQYADHVAKNAEYHPFRARPPKPDTAA
jgi:hypothetical protein